MNSNYFNQSYYQNVPPSEVNWADLAQRWIMTRAPIPPKDGNVPSSSFGFPPAPPSLRMVPPMPPPFPPQPTPLNAAGPSFYGNWPGDLRGPPPPFMPPPGCFPPANAFQQNTDNEEYKAHYDSSLEQDDEQLVEEGGAPVGAMSHWFSGLSDAPPQKASIPPEWMVESMWSSMPPPHGGMPSQFPIIDNQMRKRLPAWILEGLEKAEKEKQKKMQKDDQRKQVEELQKAKEAKRAEKGKGKFDSDSESDEEGDDNEAKGASGSTINNNGNSSKLKDEPTFPLNRVRTTSIGEKEKTRSEEFKIELTLEERKQEALLAMRRLMTMVLLEATQSELDRIARECLERSKSKARPKLLASSDALTALTSFGGDDDDEDENEDDTNGDDSRADTKSNQSRTVTSSANVVGTSVEKAPKRSSVAPSRGNLAAILRPPTPEPREKRASPTRSKDRSESPDRHRHHSSSSRHHSSRHHSSRHGESSDRHHADSSSSKSRSSESSKRRSDDSPPSRHHSSSKKRRH